MTVPKELFSIFNRKTTESLARKTRLMKRKGKFEPFSFLLALTFGHLGMKLPSLTGFVAAGDMSLSREGLHKRFSKEAVEFLSACLQRILTTKIAFQGTLKANVLKQFSGIYLMDSSGWKVSEELKDIFPGAGGCRAKASCKMQLAYELKTGQVVLSDITAGRDNDRMYSRKLPTHIEPGSLVMADLGYYTSKFFFDR